MAKPEAKQKLNKVAKKWVAALRSGKIKQTRGQLGRESGSRCCLGVLCDLAVEEGVITKYRFNEGVLPKEVIKWSGIKDSCGSYVRKRGIIRHLTDDNDKSKRLFPK
jgi:hypothetical protein